MPQINRIRVNNIKYNFGTQYYDDFLMRFSCKNTIYDLANGGGKSVLMLLLLQTMLPNCTLDEKQPVEKLFATAGGSTTIHSLVEWKLDSCDVKNGYKYMTCGFCARKGRAGEDEEETQKGAGIEYFNYCIFYREFGDNDIKNLPLSSGGERITYNGLKAYLRDLEKKDFGVKVKLFERKGDYLSFINEYGIYESHWELVRGINKTEGHVRTYFESNYKTTRKVVEDLLIEEIIEKSYNNRIRGGNGDDEMARTLLEIKDKLLELARRREDIDNYEKELALLNEFSAKVNDFGSVFARKETGKNSLFKYLFMAGAQVAKKENNAARLSEKLSGLKSARENEERLIAASLIAEEEAGLKEVRELVDSLSEKNDAMSAEYEKRREELEMSYAAEDYADYVNQETELLRLKEYMDNRHKDRSQITDEMRRLAGAKHLYMAQELADSEKSLNDLLGRERESREALENLNENFRIKDNECARAEGIIVSLKKQVEELGDDIKEKLSRTPLLVVENAAQEACEYAERTAELKNKLAALSEEEAQLNAKKESCIRERAQTDASLELTAQNLDRISERLSAARQRENELTALGKVYGEPNHEKLTAVLGHFYDNMLAQREQLKKKTDSVREYISSIENLKPADSKGVQKLCGYLQSRYEGSIISGAEYLRNKNSDECAELAGRYPYLPYSVLVGDDYGNICRDKNVMTMDCGVVPIIKLDAVEGTTDAHDADAYMLACRDLSFIYDEAGRMSGIRKASEELEQAVQELTKLEDRLAVVRTDYERVSGYACTAGENAAELEGLLGREKHNEGGLRDKADNLRELYDTLEGREKELCERRIRLEEQLAENLRIKENLDDLAELNRSLAECHLEITGNEAVKDAAVKARKLSKELHDGRERAYNELIQRRTGIQKNIENLKNTWAMYEPYYKEADDAVEMKLVPSSEIDARFMALRSLLNEELGDITDKERLMESCRTAMDKAVRSMLHRGITLEKAKELAAQGGLQVKNHEDILIITEEQDKLRQSIRDVQSELDSASAQMNRIEGSCAHARKNYEEHYGTLDAELPDNPREYTRQHQAELERLKKELSDIQAEEKKNQQEHTACLLMQKDLERIVKSVTPDADDIIKKKSAEYAESDLSEEFTDAKYEEAGRSFEAVLKDEQKKRTSFLRARDLLVDRLTMLKAYELAQEIKQNIQPPQSQAEADELSDALRGTAGCIVLERDRISRGIEDMELIKSNFENRCVQICTNIRSELERLDKLSRITLDDEVIPVLSLQIPYIKEEMYKDRMSVYINETVSSAENFKTIDERLKYIRGRLSWKRLFSVIVTDMNSIRLNLYKRERIKDQSRYLRYEEAVGSTGQSQGIYIQFLVSIINYIASINAGGKEAAVLGKTIFIDNPFGAAKDVYIWEPIFKLLKTNHVQLIVPARGATPAITGRFDVNYVLGQKLVDKKQQTVVVDYHSQVAEQELEYERLSFSQESFDFL